MIHTIMFRIHFAEIVQNYWVHVCSRAMIQAIQARVAPRETPAPRRFLGNDVFGDLTEV
jgi:hypothetical protein